MTRAVFTNSLVDTVRRYMYMYKVSTLHPTFLEYVHVYDIYVHVMYMIQRVLYTYLIQSL